MPTAKGNLTYLERLLQAGEREGIPPTYAAMDETAVEKAVCEWADQWGWDLSYHVNDSRVDQLRRRGRRVDSGFPDRVWGHLRWGRIIVVELKDMLRPVQPNQANWLSVYARAGHEVGVWRPSDLVEGGDAWRVLSNQLRLRPPAKSAWRG